MDNSRLFVESEMNNSDLEDSVSLGTIEDAVEHQPTSRRRLQRLHKADDVPPSNPSAQVESVPWAGEEEEEEQSPDYWDEEDEYADQLHKKIPQEDAFQGSQGVSVW